MDNIQEQAKILTEESNREQLNRLLGHDGVDGTYYYCLTRVKEAFHVGTMTLDDFVEVDEQLTDEIIGHFQPQIDSLLSANAELSWYKNAYKQTLKAIADSTTTQIEALRSMAKSTLRGDDNE